MKPLELNRIQKAALRRLATDPAASGIEAATLAFLRKHGLVGKVVTVAGGHQKTISPITPKGFALL